MEDELYNTGSFSLLGARALSVAVGNDLACHRDQAPERLRRDCHIAGEQGASRSERLSLNTKCLEEPNPAAFIEKAWKPISFGRANHRVSLGCQLEASNKESKKKS